MSRLFSWRALIVGALILILFSALTAIAATNTVPPTRLDLEITAVTYNDLRPPACVGMYITNLVIGSGVINGTSGNDLILGSSGTDTIDGLGGNDCILAGGGDDALIGGDGEDVCLGGPGTDIFITCETENQ